MSKLEVDKVTPQSGTTLTIGDAGDTTVINGLGTLPATIGTAAQVLSVNAGATGLQYGTAVTDLSNLNATNLTSGTIPDARFPSTLPTANGQNLTAINPTAISSGTLPALNAANLTNLNATTLTSGTIPAARISSLPAGVGGKVLQVVTDTLTSEYTTGSTSFNDTGLTLNITPAASSSKILIIAHLGGIYSNTSGNKMIFTCLRGSTNIGHSTMGFGFMAGFSDGRALNGDGFTFLDSPSTTSATTYKVQARLENATGAGQISQESATSTITCIEIGA